MAASISASSFVATIFPLKTSNSPISDACISSFLDYITTIKPDGESFHKTLDGGNSPTVVEVTFWWAQQVALDDIKRSPALEQFQKTNHVQVVIQIDNVFRRFKRLAVFDMDSTLIQQEVIDEIARKLGVEAQVSAITERAMNGELDFEASLRERCGLLRGVPSTVFEDLKPVITQTPGAANLVKVFKRLGYKTAVLSGGFTPLASWLANQLGLDYAHANHLVVSKDGRMLTGELEGVIVHAERKAALVQQIAKENNIDLSQVIVVGDGANDLPMMKVAGLGVAFNAKEKVQREAPVRINRDSLEDIAFLLGLSRTELNELLAVE